MNGAEPEAALFRAAEGAGADLTGSFKFPRNLEAFYNLASMRSRILRLMAGLVMTNKQGSLMRFVYYGGSD